MKKILRFLFSRTFVFGLGILLQIAILVLLILFLSNYGIWIYMLFTVLSACTILYVISGRDNPIYKLAWVIPIAFFPLYGWLLYLMVGRSSLTKKQEQLSLRVQREVCSHAAQDPQILQALTESDPVAGKQMHYISGCTQMPVYGHTIQEYLSPGEAFFARLCEELERAERFIFMEYFIIQGGMMWDTILDILKRKAAAGVEVKLIYDDFGCLFTLPSRYWKQLRQAGIQTHVFNPFRPSIDALMNYRDHRKITVIDGSVGFTGGNNLADEYINAYEKHGHWKDSSILLKGDAVWNLSLLFLQVWQVLDRQPVDYDRYRPTVSYPSDGYVTVFGDSPLDGHLVGETCYMQIIENARQYVSITTPYLILDNEMTTALCVAAQSGVQVRIITPGIPDKWYVHRNTRCNYRQLLAAGVEIYEYTGGFIHAKTIVSDDRTAVVGTQNFDFRSFYLHFELSALLFHSSAVHAVRQDHLETLTHCHRITEEELARQKLPERLLDVILTLFAPLM